jgi:signal transduction histidine kinase
MVRSGQKALTISWITLRVLILLNWIYGAVVLAILTGLFFAPGWTMTALGVPPSAHTVPLILGMSAIAALGLVAAPLNFAILRRLAAMVETVRAGDPFVAINASRLQAIAWFLLAEQLLSLAIGLIGDAVSTPEHALHLDAGLSPGGWLAVILTFVLARVFGEGTLMREDLEGTV